MLLNIEKAYPEIVKEISVSRFRQDHLSYEFISEAILKDKSVLYIEQMSPEELGEFNAKYMHGAGATVNFVTNIAGAMIVAECIKLLTGSGKPCCFPNVIDFDIYNLKLQVKNSYSPFSMENIKKVFGKWNKTKHFSSLGRC